ncbi:MAG: hypothetical protein RIB59_03010 [Rhodospirillales bacterium]
MSEAVIGVTLVAFGTSLPELAAATVSAVRGHSGLALGTVIGSNIFNISGIVGIAAVAAPLAVPAQTYLFDIWVMLGVTAFLFVFLAGLWKTTRLVGVLFLTMYCLFIAAQVYGVERLLGLFNSIS